MGTAFVPMPRRFGSAFDCACNLLLRVSRISSALCQINRYGCRIHPGLTFAASLTPMTRLGDIRLRQERKESPPIIREEICRKNRVPIPRI